MQSSASNQCLLILGNIPNPTLGIVSMGRKFRAMCDNGLLKTLALYDFKVLWLGSDT